MITEPQTPGSGDMSARRLPPVAQVAVASMALVIASGIYVAAHLPQGASLGPAAGLLCASGVLLLADIAVISRLRDFAWKVFFRVGGWALLAYGVIAGLLEFVFVFDHTRGSVLLVLTLSLLVFAIDIPLILAFSVARYQPVPAPGP